MTTNDGNTGAGRVAAENADARASEIVGDSGLDARVYRVLGEQLLVLPDRDRAEAVGIWASEWQCSADSLPIEIETALERIQEGATADVEALREAYTHLFRGVSERAPDPPYESMYVDGSFYSGTTTEIRKGYRWAGVDVDDSHGNEPPDHLGLELQFLGELVAMEDTDRGPDEPDLDDARWWLLDEHLTEWLPTYHARLQQEDPHKYYAGLLDLALAVVTAHHNALAEGR
ncbi:TorD/DmsD family molecular chaperone [Halorientalis salina]|uniref:TorD/DmsD family molecular chaperone n=1 Tax=Halorientalis salina TaxID=2932266 RepID=UPI0010ADA477|nr:molecular chaperone TorD family protein [Halorientalis salina]